MPAEPPDATADDLDAAHAALAELAPEQAFVVRLAGEVVAVMVPDAASWRALGAVWPELIDRRFATAADALDAVLARERADAAEMAAEAAAAKERKRKDRARETDGGVSDWLGL